MKTRSAIPDPKYLYVVECDPHGDTAKARRPRMLRAKIVRFGDNVVTIRWAPV